MRLNNTSLHIQQYFETMFYDSGIEGTYVVRTVQLDQQSREIVNAILNKIIALSKQHVEHPFQLYSNSEPDSHQSLFEFITTNVNLVVRGRTPEIASLMFFLMKYIIDELFRTTYITGEDEVPYVNDSIVETFQLLYMYNGEEDEVIDSGFDPNVLSKYITRYFEDTVSTTPSGQNVSYYPEDYDQFIKQCQSKLCSYKHVITVTSLARYF
jgi:hypothetical protein